MPFTSSDVCVATVLTNTAYRCPQLSFVVVRWQRRKCPISSKTVVVPHLFICDVAQLPEILFGNNALEFYHKPSGFLLQFEARRALAGWVKLFADGNFEVCSTIDNGLAKMLLMPLGIVGLARSYTSSFVRPVANAVVKAVRRSWSNYSGNNTHRPRLHLVNLFFVKLQLAAR